MRGIIRSRGAVARSAWGGQAGLLRSGLLWSGLVLGGVAVTGCANAETAQLQQRVKALESEVASLRNSQGRLEDQVAGVRARQSAAPTGGSTQEGRVADSGRLLQVVRVVPAEAAAGSPGDAGASEAPVTAPSAAPSAGPEKPRPIIRGTGERIEGRYIEEPTSSWAPKGDEQDTGRSS